MVQLRSAWDGLEEERPIPPLSYHQQQDQQQWPQWQQRARSDIGSVGGDVFCLVWLMLRCLPSSRRSKT